MSENQDRGKSRARLWLRSEQALGLGAVALPSAPAPQEAQPSLPGLAAVAAGEHLGMTRESPAALPARQPFTAPLLPTEEKRQRLAELDEKEVRICTRCQLCQTRTRTVVGEGDPDARLLFIGEGPGATEDATGRPFVGRAGELLDRMIAGMGLKRQQVFIANVIKCRAFLPGPPAKDRAPTPDEVATCTPYLERQIEIIRPAVIVTLGVPAAKHMLGDPRLTTTAIRGQWRTWRGIKLMPTFHPAYVLRNYTPETRAAVWSDLKKVMAELRLPAPSRMKDE